MTEHGFRIAKIRCAGCAQTIAQARSGVPGVTGTRVAVAAKEVRVDVDPARIDEAQRRQVLAGADFPPA